MLQNIFLLETKSTEDKSPELHLGIFQVWNLERSVDKGKKKKKRARKIIFIERLSLDILLFIHMFVLLLIEQKNKHNHIYTLL